MIRENLKEHLGAWLVSVCACCLWCTNLGAWQIDDNETLSGRVEATHLGSGRQTYDVVVPDGKRAVIRVTRSSFSTSNCKGSMQVNFGGRTQSLSANGSSVNTSCFAGTMSVTVEAYVSSVDTYTKVEEGWYYVGGSKIYYPIYKEVEYSYYSAEGYFDLSVTYEDLSPDLTVSEISMSIPDESVEDELLTLSFSIYNIGFESAEGSRANVYDGETLLLTVEVSALSANQKCRKIVSIPALSVGAHSLKVDVEPVTDEKVTGNNGTQVSHVVHKRTAYSLQFDSNGGNGSMENQPMVCGTKMELSENRFLKDGHVFCGWARTSDGSVAFEDGEIVENLSYVENDVVILYAVWRRRIESKLIYHANGGVGSDYEQVTTNGMAYSLIPNRFAREGFIFCGWAFSESSYACYCDCHDFNNPFEEVPVTNHLFAVWGSQMEGGVTDFRAFSGGDKTWSVASNYLYWSWRSYAPACDIQYMQGVPDNRRVFTNGNVGKGMKSWLQVNVDGAGQIAFDVKTFIEADTSYDKGSYLRFFVDGVCVKSWSGFPAFDHPELDFWKHHIQTLVEGKHVLVWAFERDGNKTRDWNSVMVKSIHWVDSGGTRLNDALNCANLDFIVDEGDWFAQTQYAHDETSAMECTIPPSGLCNEMSTDVNGAGRLSFMWKAESHLMGSSWSAVIDSNFHGEWHDGEVVPWDHEIVTLYVDGIARTSIVHNTATAVGWERIVVDLGAGVHNIRWCVPGVGNGGYYQGVWLDEVQWEPTQYKVAYESGMYCVSDRYEDVKDHGVTVSLRGPLFVRDGYTQTGWSKNADGSTKDYELGAPYTDDAAITLYPYWTANLNTYAVYYQAGSYGTGSEQSATKVRGQSLTLRGMTFTRTGYAQTGWSKNADGSTKDYELGAQYTDDTAITLYPSWTAKTYTIRFMANGGTGTMADQTLTYDVAQMLSANRFKYEGKHFVGWATRERGAVVYKNRAEVKNLTAEQGGLVYLYAVWEDGSEGLYPNDPGETIGSNENAPYATAAVTYDGYLYGEDDIVVGSVQVKVAKGKVDRKSGMFSAKVTATVQLADGSKKIGFKGGIADETGKVTGLTATGHVLEVALGVNGLGGTFDGKYQIDGARNVFGAKDAEAKAVAAAVDARWAGNAVNIVCGGDVLTVTIAKKGRVKVSGMVNGVKVTATSQMLVGETCCCIPVVITKKAKLAFTLWLGDGGIDVVGLGDGAVADMARPLKAGAKFNIGDAGAALLDALGEKGERYGEYRPDGLSVAQSGKKWIVADGAKAGKVMVNRKTGEIDESKLGVNPSGLKLTYKAKDGTFKGSFKVYNLENGKIKSYTVKVTGVMIGDIGYGTATIKNPACTFPISIE